MKRIHKYLVFLFSFSFLSQTMTKPVVDTISLTMSGVQLLNYGPPQPSSLFYSQDLPVPEMTRSTEVLIRIKAAGVNPNETKEPSENIKIFTTCFSPLPHIIGADFSGIIVDKGKDVKKFNIGDQVFGTQPFPFCIYGTYAQYSVVDTSEAAIAIIPKHLSFEQAACTGMAVTTAYRGIVDNGLIIPANMRENRKIIVVGASGGVGSYGVQIAKAINPENLVIGICSGKNAEFVKSLGADKVVDYTDRKAYDAFIDSNVKGTFDIIFNCIIGEDYHYRKLSPLLKRNDSVYSFIMGPTENIGLPYFAPSFAEFSLFCTSTYKNVFAKHRYAVVNTLFCSYAVFEAKIVPLFQDQKIRAPIVESDSIIPLKDAYRAQEILSSTHAVGKIVLTVD